MSKPTSNHGDDFQNTIFFTKLEFASVVSASAFLRSFPVVSQKLLSSEGRFSSFIDLVCFHRAKFAYLRSPMVDSHVVHYYDSIQKAFSNLFVRITVPAFI